MYRIQLLHRKRSPSSIFSLYRQKNHFYCSEFVADVLKSYRIIEGNSLSEVVKPMDLLSLENAKIVYKGLTSKLRNDPVFDVSIINIKRAEE